MKPSSGQPGATFGPFTEDGVVVVHGRGFDDEGAYVDATASIVIANVAQFATLVVNPPDSNGTVTVSLADANDPGSDDTVFKYAFNLVYNNLPTTFAAAGSSASATFTEAQLTGGTVIHARIFDADNGYRNYSLGVTDMSAQVISSSQINLTWTSNVTDEAGWWVQWSDDGSFSDGHRWHVDLPADTERYEARGIPEGTRRWFRVRAFDDATHPGWTMFSPRGRNSFWSFEFTCYTVPMSRQGAVRKRGRPKKRIAFPCYD